MTGPLAVVLLGAPLVLLLATPFFWAGAVALKGGPQRRMSARSYGRDR